MNETALGPAEADIVKGRKWRIGDDRPLLFKVTLPDNKTVPNGIETWAFEWALRITADALGDALITKTTPDITVVTAPDPFYKGSGTPPDIKLVQVPVLRADYPPQMREGTFWHSLARTDLGSHLTLAEGWAWLAYTATR